MEEKKTWAVGAGSGIGWLKALLVSLGKNPDDFAIEVVPEGMHPSVCAAKLIHAGKADFLW